MWTQLSLDQFKCFRQTAIELRPLTLFCGVNSSGKSSAIQALALLNQTIADNEWNQDIQLNGSSVSLGTTEDVINRTTGRSCFSIGLKTANCDLNWVSDSGDRKEDLVASVTSIKLHDGKVSHAWNSNNEGLVGSTQKPLFCLLPAEWHTAIKVVPDVATKLCSIKYLSAERLGPRETYPLSLKADFANVGAKGEWTAHYLDRFGGDDANDGLLTDNKGKTIRRTVVNWMNRLFPGFDLSVQRVHGTGLVTLKIQTSESTPMFRPQNVGFGLSHILPIVTLCVGSRRGDCLVIESPETHLHPAGQSQIGLLLGLTAASGVQIIVETHSDHVLNGIRIAISRKILSSKEAVFNFFHLEDSADEIVHAVTGLVCDDRGRFASWPKKFFDQMQMDLLELA